MKGAGHTQERLSFLYGCEFGFDNRNVAVTELHFPERIEGHAGRHRDLQSDIEKRKIHYRTILRPLSDDTDEVKGIFGPNRDITQT